MNIESFRTLSIEQLQDRERELRAELQAVSTALRAALIAASGVSIGQVVKTENGNEYLVTEIKPWMAGRKPWIVGAAKRKDGTWGKGKHHLYSDWEVVEGASG